MVNMKLAGTYYAAVIENRADFLGRVVVDVGAGSGILSLFAAQVFFCTNEVYVVSLNDMNHSLVTSTDICTSYFFLPSLLSFDKNPLRLVQNMFMP